MKNSAILSVILLFVLTTLSYSTENNQSKKENTSKIISNKIEVYYFHYTRRCVTCQAVEDETIKALKKLYPIQIKKGQIIFKSVNLDEKTNDELAEKCKVSGQNLLVMGAKKRIDLTEIGFMYAKTKPEKLKEELKKAIDSLL